MANDEVLAAAERLRTSGVIASVRNNLKRWRAWFPSEESEVDVPRADLVALCNIADAYLAHLAAEAERERERAEPVTAAVLDSRFVGHDLECGWRRWFLHQLPGCYVTIERSNEGQFAVMVGVNRVATNPTINQLEYLLRGLGIEAKREGGM